MGISETKKQIVIDNYFEKECDVNTSIKEAFIKGFELGLKKAPTTSQPKIGHWIYWHINGFGRNIYKCSKCNWYGDAAGYNYCPNCGVKMVELKESEGDNGRFRVSN